MVTKITIKPAYQRHYAEIAALEQAIWPVPLCLAQVGSLLADRGGNGFVAVDPCSGTVVGYMLYQMAGRRFVLAGMGVLPSWRRRGIGSRLFSPLNNKLLGGKADAIWCSVAERDLPVQLFLQSCGFRCDLSEGFWVPRWEVDLVPGYRFVRSVEQERADASETLELCDRFGLAHEFLLEQ